MELISREDLRDKMYHEAFEIDSDMQRWDSGCWIRYKLFESVLDGLPTVESRPKGKWLDEVCGRICSNCLHEFDRELEYICLDDENNYVMPNYCPWCGAEMEKE